MYIISNHLFVRNNCWDFTNLFTNLSHFVFSTIVFIAYSQVESYWEPSIRSVRDIIDIVRREMVEYPDQELPVREELRKGERDE